MTRNSPIHPFSPEDARAELLAKEAKDNERRDRNAARMRRARAARRAMRDGQPAEWRELSTMPRARPSRFG